MKSKKPKKQRKERYSTQWQRRHKLLTARLAPELVDKHGIKRIPVIKGDTVYVTRGAFRDSEGDIETVDMKNLKIQIENITIEKVDGTAISLPIHPSNVMITKLKIDKARQDVIDRIAAARRELEEKED
ncbi:MAG: 50S ribosomal protein L24 [Candidatus Hermodarchaeia archaeon]|jgi:large subunit ribosomal protein L24